MPKNAEPDCIGLFSELAFTADSDWGKCLIQFLQSIYEKSGSFSSFAHYKSIVRTFFSTSPARMPDEYTRSDVQAFIMSPCQSNGRVGKKACAGTINSRLATLRSFYNFAAGYGLRNEQDGRIYPILRSLPPTAGVRHLKAPRGQAKALNEEELKRFFAAIPRDTILGARDYALFLTYFWTARRRSEILNLRWGDIEQTVLVGTNGQRREGYLYHFRGKGRSRIDDVAELPEPAYKAIVAYLEKAGRLERIEPDDPIFTASADYKGVGGYDVHRPLSGQSIWRNAKQYAKQAGLAPSRVTVHTMRHTAARSRYSAGMDIRAVSQLLRHSGIGVTDSYLATIIATADEGIDLLASKFSNL